MTVAAEYFHHGIQLCFWITCDWHKLKYIIEVYHQRRGVSGIDLVLLVSIHCL